jgi:hypothetical protein
VGAEEIGAAPTHPNRDETALRVGHPPRSNPVPVRGAQSCVHTLSACWRQPSLTALEVAWRWTYGVPAFVLVAWQAQKVLLAATGGTLDPARLGLDKTLLNDPVGALSGDPLGAAGKFSNALGLVLPGLAHVAVWLAPLLLVAWVVVSSLGRTVVLRRADAALHRRLGTLMVLQAIRMVVLAALVWAWYAAVEWSGRVAIVAPTATGAEPNLILYCAMIIVLSLGMFTAWAFVSWYLSVAPLLAMLNDTGPLASLAAAGRLGVLKTKLVEVNLIMGIVKIALIVLAMVFSATPLPFQDVTTPEFLAWWWAGVTLLYLLWSDFFQVARLIAYLNLWRAFAPQN